MVEGKIPLNIYILFVTQWCHRRLLVLSFSLTSVPHWQVTHSWLPPFISLLARRATRWAVYHFKKEEGGFQVSTSLETLARRNYSVGGRWAALRSAVGQCGGGDVRELWGGRGKRWGKRPEERMWLCLSSEGHILLLSHTFPSRKMKIGTSRRSDLVTVYCMGGRVSRVRIRSYCKGLGVSVVLDRYDKSCRWGCGKTQCSEFNRI